MSSTFTVTADETALRISSFWPASLHRPHAPRRGSCSCALSLRCGPPSHLHRKPKCLPRAVCVCAARDQLQLRGFTRRHWQSGASLLPRLRAVRDLRPLQFHASPPLDPFLRRPLQNHPALRLRAREVPPATAGASPAAAKTCGWRPRPSAPPHSSAAPDTPAAAPAPAPAPAAAYPPPRLPSPARAVSPRDHRRTRPRRRYLWQYRVPLSAPALLPSHPAPAAQPASRQISASTSPLISSRSVVFSGVVQRTVTVGPARSTLRLLAAGSSGRFNVGGSGGPGLAQPVNATARPPPVPPNPSRAPR